MKKKLKKLIAEYKKKISTCDQHIFNYTRLKKDAEFFKVKKEIAIAVKELAALDIKRELYLQVKADIESLQK